MKKENKFCLKLFLLLLLVFCLGGAGEALALGASVSFEPDNLTTKAGQVFELAIVLTPSAGSVYTGKIQLRFPADALEVKSFKMSDGFMPMQQPGYDLADNSAGLLIKTGGYPGGFSKPTAFGRVSFLVKKTGQATIAVDTPNSLMLDALGKNTLLLSGAFVATIMVLPTTVQTAPTTAASVSSETKPATEVVSEVSSNVTTEQVGATAQTAAVAASGEGIPLWGWILLGLAVIAIVGYGAYALGKRQKM